jgi:hypothetical protein
MAKTKTRIETIQTIPTAPKISDVTSDSSVGANSSSRPVIVSNRPIMRDPMMAPITNESKLSDTTEKTSGSSTHQLDPSGAPLLDPPSVTKKKIVPPSDIRSHRDNKISDITPATSIKPAAKIDVVSVATHDSIPESIKISSTAKTDKKTSGQTNSTSTPDADEAEDGDNSDQETQDAAEANTAAETRDADEAEKVSKLVEAKTYLLPINALQRKRSQQIALLGMFLIILLAIAWLDLATDVGLIHVPFLPVTHFFGHS